MYTFIVLINFNAESCYVQIYIMFNFNSTCLNRMPTNTDIAAERANSNINARDLTFTLYGEDGAYRRKLACMFISFRFLFTV